MMKVKEMNKQERPREKAVKEGMEHLSNRELLAILLRSGTKDKSVLELADEILHLKQDLISLMDLRIEDLMKIKGIKTAKATQLLACFELTKRMSCERMWKQYQEESEPEVVGEWLMNHIGHENQEHFVVVFLDQRAHMLGHKDLFIGTGSKSFANPREVFAEALRYGSSKIICAHNHPSGCLIPSDADMASAKALEESGNLLGIRVIDHLIVSRYAYYSFREHFLMTDQRKLLQQELLQQLEEQAGDHHPLSETKAQKG